MEKMKRFKRLWLVICLLLVGVVSTRVDAATIKEGDVSEASSGCTIVGIEGSYIMDAQAALDRINEIRLEACKEGLVDPRNSSRNLTLDDYVPIQWSRNLEQIARWRAVEASVTYAHSRLNDKYIFNLKAGNTTSTGEVLAWNSGEDVIAGINQWYGEKEYWVSRDLTNETGHYTAMINPNNKYIGLGCFLNDTSYYSSYGMNLRNTLAGEFSATVGNGGSTPMDTERDIIQKVEVKDAYIGDIYVSPTLVTKGTSETITVKAPLSAYYGKSDALILGDFTYTSSDTSILTVNNGKLAGVKEGTATVVVKSKSTGAVICSTSIEVGCAHEYVYTKDSYYWWQYNKTCSICGKSVDFEYCIYKSNNSTSNFGAFSGGTFNVGDIIYVWPSYGQQTSDPKVNVTASNPEVLSLAYQYGTMRKVTMLKAGISYLYVNPVEDPYLNKALVIRVKGETAADISGASVILSSYKYNYTGSECKPTPIVEYNGIPLTKGTDYTVTYENNIEEGTGVVVISGTGVFGGEKRVTFAIEKPSVADADVKLSETEVTYNGRNFTPSVTVTFEGKTLKENTDYKVTYSNNKNAGQASVTIEGINMYGGVAYKYFTIKRAALDEDYVGIEDDDFVYCEKNIEPAVSIVFNGKTLKLGTDFKVAYKNNFNVNSNAEISVTGLGNFDGTVTKYFKIVPRNVKEYLKAEFDNNKLEYTGAYQTPKLTVTDVDGLTVVMDTDYSVSKANAINAGSYTLTITGSGNYTGSMDIGFSIEQKNINTYIWSLSENKYTYDGNYKEPTINYKGTGVKITNADVSATYENNKNAGTAKAIVEGVGNFTGRIELDFTIDPLTLVSDNISLSQDVFYYNGKVQKPDVTVKTSDTNVLKENENYTVTYHSGTDKGTYYLEVKGTGNYAGTVKKYFNINAKNIDSADVKYDGDYVYNGQEIKPVPTITFEGNTLVNSKDFTVTYSKNINAGTANAHITFGGNYSGEIDSSFNIAARNISDIFFIKLSATRFVYNGSSQIPDVTVSNYLGMNVYENTDYSVSTSPSVNVGKVVVTVSGKNNYKGTKTAEYYIDAKDFSDYIVSLDVNEYTYDGNEKTPGITFEDKNISSKDYDVSYYKNVNAGDARVEISGKGNYKGTINKYFKINPLEINEKDVNLEKTEYEYTGANIIPKETIVVNGVTLVRGIDYTVADIEAVKPDSYNVTYTGKNNYSGQITKSYEIKKKSVEGLNIKLSQDSFTYDGSKKEPSIEIIYGGNTLVLGQDYDAEIPESISVGSYEIVITGKGDYFCGETTVKYFINEIRVEEPGSEDPEIVTPGEGDDEKTVLEEPDFTQENPWENVKASTLEKVVSEKTNDDDIEGSVFGILKTKITNVKKNSLKVKWAKVSVAKTYVVYGNKCGSKNKLTLIKKTNKTSFSARKLKKGTYYKYLVVALNGDGNIVGVSKVVHASTKGGKYCNQKSIKLSVKSKSLTVGKSFKLKAKQVLESKSKKSKKHRAVKFESSDSKVATVDSKGKVTAKGRGTCYIYAYAQNGIMAKCKITVK